MSTKKKTVRKSSPRTKVAVPDKSVMNLSKQDWDREVKSVDVVWVLASLFLVGMSLAAIMWMAEMVWQDQMMYATAFYSFPL